MALETRPLAAATERPEHRDIVCGMNLALADGMLQGLRDDRLEASLDPRPDGCCVAFRVRP